MLQCLKGEYFILAREQVYKEWYLHFPATSNFPIHHLPEPQDLTQCVECLHTLNDPFTKRMSQMQMRKLVNIADAAMLDPLISHCGSDLHINLIYTWSENSLKAYDKSCTVKANQTCPCKLPRWKTTQELHVSYSEKSVGRAGYISQNKQSLLSLIKTSLSNCEFDSQQRLRG